MSRPDDLLADLLAGRVPPAAYRWDAAYDVADVRSTVERAGWRFGYLDGSAHPTRAETLAALGDALALPDWWGRNLDALADCLRDLAAEPATARTVLLWDHWATQADHDPRAFTLAVRLLAGAAEEDGEAGAGITVLLRGAGPDLPT